VHNFAEKVARFARAFAALFTPDVLCRDAIYGAVNGREAIEK